MTLTTRIAVGQRGQLGPDGSRTPVPALPVAAEAGGPGLLGLPRADPG